MDHRRPLLSPIVVLLSGLASTSLWLIAAGRGFGVAAGGLQLVAAGGLAASLGGTLAALWQRYGQRKITRDFDQVRHDARHDPLTGLLNRSGLFEQLRESLDRAGTESTVVGVLFLDLDRFKAINDSLGHEAGDELLRIVADRLRAAIRSTDVVARLGGDEFVIVCRGLLSGASVLSVARQILRRFDEPVSLGGAIHDVGTSIGVAIAEPGDGRRAEELIRDADSAMYKAKREQLGYAVFDEAHRLQLVDRAAIERDLGRALDEEQFVVFYQPVVDVVAGELVGLEAYVRWNHPERGLVEPSDFWAIAREAGMMSEIGLRVLRETCAQLAVWKHLWPAAGELSIGVNLSEEQLLDPDLPRQVNDILAWTDLSPSQLVLEVSEDLMSANIDSLDALRQVSELGVTVAIDCFGAGTTSFRFVKSLDMVTVLKIDRSFVRDILHDPSALAVVGAMVATARALGRRVVAEGVEHPEQVELLRGLGIRVMQGYLFNEPVYADVVDRQAWFEDRGTEGWRSPGLRPLVAYHAGQGS